MNFIIGKKIEMTQLFDEAGRVIPVTLIDVKESVVLGKRTSDIDGYTATIIGIGKKSKPTKAELGKYKELGFVPQYVAEFKSESDKEQGSSLLPSSFEINSKVNISGISKGKGFQGGVKRHGFHGGPKTHGQSDRHRAPGSIGAGTTPGRVIKGQKMPGRMGNDKITVKNLTIVKCDDVNGIIVVKGAVPGKRGTILKISQTVN